MKRGVLSPPPKMMATLKKGEAMLWSVTRKAFREGFQKHILELDVNSHVRST
jgi:hypothetical protein